MKLIKLIIADSNNLVRIGLRTVFSKNSEIQLLGEAKENEELKEMTINFKPDVVLLDYTSSGFSIDVVVWLKNKFKDLHVVAITPDQSAQIVVDALRSGISSHIKKDCDFSEILDAVTETSKGNRFFCGKILETIKKAEINVEDVDFGEFNCEPVLLSERELEIIKFIAEGHTNIQIANQLVLSTHTINTHRKNIMAKLGVKNTAGIVMYAVKTELVSPNKFLFAEKEKNA